MRNFDLNSYGVQEMNAKEVLESNGGNQPVASYSSSDGCGGAGELLCEFFANIQISSVLIWW